MNIYLLSRPVATHGEATGFVVIAESCLAARNLIAEAAGAVPGGPGTEGARPWTDHKSSRCTLIGTAADTAVPGIVLRDFRAG